MSSFENELQQVTELISIPEIYLKTRQLMDDPTSDINDFARVVSIDPNLSVKLLNVVNSAYFGFTGEISSISRAVNMVGIGQLHMMVLGISAVSSLDFPNDVVPFKTFWRTSLLTGTLARELARQLKMRSAEKLFIVGLLHEIGHLVLYAKFPDLARKTIQLEKDSDISVNQAEQQVLGCHYGDIGAMLMEQWKLSADFQNWTRFQPTPELAAEDNMEISLLHIAHAYAHHKFMQTDKPLEEQIIPATWEITRLTTEQVEQKLESALLTSSEMERVILN